VAWRSFNFQAGAARLASVSQIEESFDFLESIEAIPHDASHRMRVRPASE
jgi:hypothetical protein